MGEYTIKLDDGLWRALEAYSSSTGETPDSVAEMAIRTFLTVDVVLEGIWETTSQFEISEEEANRIAVAELDAMRSERAASE